MNSTELKHSRPHAVQRDLSINYEDLWKYIDIPLVFINSKNILFAFPLRNLSTKSDCVTMKYCFKIVAINKNIPLRVNIIIFEFIILCKRIKMLAKGTSKCGLDIEKL